MFQTFIFQGHILYAVFNRKILTNLGIKHLHQYCQDNQNELKTHVSNIGTNQKLNEALCETPTFLSDVVSIERIH